MAEIQGNWKKVGKVKEPHGLKGDLYILVFSKAIDWLEDIENFILATGDDPTSGKIFEIEKVKPFKDGLMLKPKGINNRNESDLLKGKMFFIPDEVLVSEEGETIYLSEVLGFEVVDPENKLLGKITSFSSNGVQDLLVLEKVEGGTAEVPFVEDFIVEIEFENKKIIMDLPEGLLNLDGLP